MKTQADAALAYLERTKESLKRSMRPLKVIAQCPLLMDKELRSRLFRRKFVLPNVYVGVIHVDEAFSSYADKIDMDKEELFNKLNYPLIKQ